VFPRIALDSIVLGEALYAWLIAVPAVLLPVWLWRTVSRQRERRSIRHRHVVPVPERMSFLGAWPFWLCVLLACTLTIVALTRPRASVGQVRTAGVDLIVLQDGSASMYVRDVSPDRWQRSTRFLRVLAESMRWEDDRIALALFARIAAPQVRLTRDPNTFFFFLDHLDRESPFPLSADTTWDTNIELGLYWGTRLIEKDEELHGRSANSRAFVLVSDGQSWSGEVERALAAARSRDIPVFAVGVGTAAGGDIPAAPAAAGAAASSESPIRAILDRGSLLAIASAGGGQYFDLDRDSDRRIAGAIIDAVRRRAGARGIEPVSDELYWACLLAAACLLGLGVLFLEDRVELALHALATGGAMAAVWMLGG
jgi:Ca-activated chloride channel family protein